MSPCTRPSPPLALAHRSRRRATCCLRCVSLSPGKQRSRCHRYSISPATASRGEDLVGCYYASSTTSMPRSSSSGWRRRTTSRQGKGAIRRRQCREGAARLQRQDDRLGPRPLRSSSKHLHVVCQDGDLDLFVKWSRINRTRPRWTSLGDPCYPRNPLGVGRCPELGLVRADLLPC